MRWDHAEPFGNSPANENPSGLGTFGINYRFPGQYLDKASNTHYNMARDFDSAIGGYIQPEPLGLFGDINLYRYARNNSLSYVDPTGEAATLSWCLGGPVPCAVGVGAAGLIWVMSQNAANKNRSKSSSCDLCDLAGGGSAPTPVL